MSAPDRYAVMGNPIAHSKSPRIHSLFAAQTNQHMCYEAILVEPGGFADAAHRFFECGGRGLNVTVPFKQDAWKLAQVRATRAERAGAVNTLLVGKDGRYYGDNTDGAGLLRDLTQNHGLDLRGRSVLILGAGGAVRGVLEPLLDARPARVFIANRTAATARQLAASFAGLGAVSGGGFDEVGSQPFGLVINGTAASLQGEVPPIPTAAVCAGCVCYDMMYGSGPTPFLQWAVRNGAQASWDGLGMLVEQAAEAFFLWRGVRPATAHVIKTLRRELAAASP